jgi:BirA family biotin operon repressor/biotin-[acetyl-CoA-carboxylase] ligase
MPHAFDQDLFDSLVRSRDLELGRSLLYSPSTASTNDVVLSAMAEGAPHGLIAVADFQTAGRGRRGRTWLSPRPAENLLFTVLLRPERNKDDVSNVTLVIGLALHDALASYVDDEIQLKWTNDIVVGERKLAGILVESQLRNDELSLAVGIGLNVHMRELPEEIYSIATSLRMLGARELRREFLLADILQHLTSRFAAWQAHGFSSMVNDFRNRDALLGRRVTVDGLEGVARGIDDTGALLLQVALEPEPRRMINGIVEYVKT